MTLFWRSSIGSFHITVVLLLLFSCVQFTLSQTAAKKTDEIVVDDKGPPPDLGSSAAFWIVFLSVVWLWTFGRKMAIHGLDYVIRQPSTLVFIMMIMYLIAWGLIELSFEMAGGYDPKMKSFGNGGDGDAFTMSLVIFSSLLSLIMWGTCSKCADKYSDFSQQKKADKLKSKNPYSDRGKQVKPISTLISTIFCTCGQVAVPEDGIDLQQMDKRVQAQMLTPPPAPASEEEYNKGMSQLKEWKKEEEFEASHTITKMLKEEAIKLEHQLEDGVKHELNVAKHIKHNMENELQRLENEAEIRMDKAEHM